MKRRLPLVVVFAAAFCGGVIATGVGRATGAGWLPALGLGALLGGGLYLFARDEKKGWGDLGQGIMVSVVVAIALLAVQRDADERTRDATERRDRQLRLSDIRRDRQLREAETRRQQAAERENLQLTLTTQTDLRGIALAHRGMRGFFLAGKNMNDADLQGSDLRDADLRHTTLRRANLLGADLGGARLQDADLRDALISPLSGSDDLDPNTLGLPAASFERANLLRADLSDTVLAGVNFRGAFLFEANLRDSAAFSLPRDFAPRTESGFRDAILIFADFRGADVSNVDFERAILGGARFCDTSGLRRANLHGAFYDASTRWPARFNPRTRGATKLGGTEAKQFEFNGVSGELSATATRLRPRGIFSLCAN